MGPVNAAERIAEARKKLNDVLWEGPELWSDDVMRAVSDYTAEVIAAVKSESETHARRAVERAIRVASNLADTASEHWSLLDILGPTDVDRIVKETK